MRPAVHICWLRRDLRLEDQAALYHALKSGVPVLPVFVFDRIILDDLQGKKDRRVEFLDNTLSDLKASLETLGSSLYTYYGTPLEMFDSLLQQYDVKEVFTNHDYEPYAVQRDKSVGDWLQSKGIAFHTYKDQVIFEKDEVVKDDGKPYTVFTPYSRKWKARLNEFYLQAYPTEKMFDRFFRTAPIPEIKLQSMGFSPAGISFPPATWKRELIQQYKEQRDIPGIKGTSRLSVHLRFGTMSIRKLAREAGAINETFLNELIWRDFYHMILWHFPQVAGHSFKPVYDQIRWRNDPRELKAWYEGKTGYPIVDAGMRELNATGFMHNRVRMIVASFFTKHLLCDWRLGEAYFAEKLLDYDLAANNGGWQWAAGSGCDAAPYFRVFNPYLQTQKFDPDLKYIRQWVPEWEELTYPQPIVNHEMARKRCLETYAVALKK